ncbi:MAG: TIGR02265 family protein [Archangium sp.]
MNSTSSTALPSLGLGSKNDLEQRLAAVGPKDTTRGFLFTAALELVRSQTDAAALKRCIEAAGGGSYTAFFSYPVSTLLKLTYAAAHELSGKYDGLEGAMQQLGFRAAPRFLESTTGKMLLSLVGKEPKRLIDSMPTAYKTAWDHGTCSLTWNGPKSGRLTYVNAIPVAYFTGSVMQILSAAQLKGAKATGLQTSLTECTVDFSWE